MRSLIRFLIAVAAVMFYGCAHRGPTIVETPTPSLDGVLRVIGRFTRAHACPFGDGKYAFTAAHVVDLRPFERVGPFGFRWSDGQGNTGSAKIVDTGTGWIVFQESDLAVVQRTDGKAFPNPYPLAKKPPLPGAAIFILGYNDGSKKSALEPKITRGKVIRVVANNLVLDEDSKPGSSGGCVLNEDAEIVGIVAWGSKFYDGSIGIAPGVWASIDSIAKLQQALNGK